ncbi:MAG: tail fiber domain-containing protein, partial [Planctomycetota bacterium]
MRSKIMLTIMVMVLALMVWLAGAVGAVSMGSAWTYQSRLMDANKPADGLYDFQFKLYDSDEPPASEQVGSDVNKPDVDVIDGYFTVELDFGGDPNVFSGQARWLQIGMRPVGDANAFKILYPRQQVTPTPYAIYAEKAGGFEGAISGNGTANYIPKFTDPDTLSDSVIYETDGNVGIGTTGPGGKLAVHYDNAGLTNAAILIDNSNVIGHDVLDFSFSGTTQARFRKANGGGLYIGTEDIQPVNFYVGGGTEMVILSDGSVGIGTTNPQNKLDVEGAMAVGFSYSGTETAPTNGMIVQGKVGIGTKNPTHKLDIYSTLDALKVGHANSWFEVRTSTNTMLSLADGEGNRAGFIGGTENAAGENVLVIVGCDDGGSCPYYTYFHESGNVGIGESDPAYKLDVDGDIRCVALHETSDVRLKTNVRQLTKVLDKVEKIRGVSFEWNEAAESVGATAGDKHIGVIAQDVEKVFPELVSEPT